MPLPHQLVIYQINQGLIHYRLSSYLVILFCKYILKPLKIIHDQSFQRSRQSNSSFNYDQKIGYIMTILKALAITRTMLSCLSRFLQVSCLPAAVRLGLCNHDRFVMLYTATPASATLQQGKPASAVNNLTIP
jgi:hypothetical protein